jgi:hypothetical protein
MEIINVVWPALVGGTMLSDFLHQQWVALAALVAAFIVFAGVIVARNLWYDKALRQADALVAEIARLRSGCQ